jgi:hypothetical protein
VIGTVSHNFIGRPVGNRLSFVDFIGLFPPLAHFGNGLATALQFSTE